MRYPLVEGNNRLRLRFSQISQICCKFQALTRRMFSYFNQYFTQIRLASIGSSSCVVQACIEETSVSRSHARSLIVQYSSASSLNAFKAQTRAIKQFCVFHKSLQEVLFIVSRYDVPMFFF